MKRKKKSKDHLSFKRVGSFQEAESREPTLSKEPQLLTALLYSKQCGEHVVRFHICQISPLYNIIN